MTIGRPVMLALAAAVLLACHGSARACSCAFGGGPPCQEFWRVDAVFSGKVLSRSSFSVEEKLGDSKYRREQVLARFSLGESYRGNVAGPEVEVVTGMGGGDCGYHFKEGERYLVYASRDARTGTLYAGICSRTRPLSEAAEDLDYFRSIPPAGSGSSITGRVIKQLIALADENQFTTSYVGGVKITAEGGGRRAETTTDQEGRYRIAGLAPGRYKVRADLPPNLNDAPEYEVEVADRGCAGADFYAQLDGEISGRVLDADGRPAVNVKVDLIPADGAASASPPARWRYTNHEGDYKIDWVPPGRFLLGVNLVGSQSGRCPYPRTYYPGAADPTGATVVEVGEGQKLSGQDMTLSLPTEEAAIEGVAVWPDGKPAAGSVLVLHNTERPYQVTVRQVAADAEGRFRLRGRAGCRYWLKASFDGRGANERGGEMVHGELLVEALAAPTKPVRVVLDSAGYECEHLTPR